MNSYVIRQEISSQLPVVSSQFRVRVSSHG